MKTLVTGIHELGPATNGHDGCNARWSDGGKCPGHSTAKWLNELGADDELYASLKTVTNGEVRASWLRGSNHLKPLHVEQAALLARRIAARKELRYVSRRLRALGLTN